IEPLHAALDQGIDLPWGVEVVRDLLAVDLQLHRVEREERARIHRHEYRHLGVGRVEQLLLEDEEIAVEVENVALQRLHLLIHGRRRGGWRTGGGFRRGDRRRRDGRRRRVDGRRPGDRRWRGRRRLGETGGRRYQGCQPG